MHTAVNASRGEQWTPVVEHSKGNYCSMTRKATKKTNAMTALFLNSVDTLTCNVGKAFQRNVLPQENGELQ